MDEAAENPGGQCHPTTPGQVLSQDPEVLEMSFWVLALNVNHWRTGFALLHVPLTIILCALHKK
jgi:hypothetical protein